MADVNYASLFESKWKHKFSQVCEVSQNKEGKYEIVNEETKEKSVYNPLLNEAIMPDGSKGNLKSLIKHYNIK